MNDIFNSLMAHNNNALVNVFAGAGKTTLCANIVNKNLNKKFLYLTFNKSMADEFKSKVGSNCDSKTLHSLAFNKLCKKGWNPGKLKYYADFPLSYSQLCKEYDLEFKTSNYEYITLKKFWTEFCVSDEISLTFVSKIRNTRNVDLQRIFLDIVKRVNTQELACSHNFYLKKWALANEVLDYDYFLFDECQDLNPLGYTILNNQKGRVIGVGDTFQNIYSELMNTVNLFNLKSNWDTYYGVNSFRVTQQTADLANIVLQRLGCRHKMVGLGQPQPLSDIYLFSSNYQLLKEIYLKNEKVCVIMNNEKYKNTVEYVENVIKYKNQQKGTDYYLNSAVEKNLTVKQVLNSYSVKDEYDKAHILLDVMNTKDLNNFTERLKALVTLNYKKNDLKTYSTVHQSKGLTFRNVYYTPPYNLSTILENPDDYVTELNLIYVALTRASDTVYMDNEHMEIFKFYDY